MEHLIHFYRGLRDFARAHQMIRAQRFWRVLIVPGILSVLLVPGFLAGGYLVLHWGLSLLVNRFMADVTDMWLTDAVLVVMPLALSVVLLLLLFRHLVLLVHSPYFESICEKVVAIRTDGELPGRGWLVSTIRGLTITAVFLTMSIAVIFLWLFLWLVPVVGWLIALVVLPLSQIFLAGAELYEAFLSAQGLTAAGALRLMRRNKMRILGTGCGFLLMLWVPVVGWIVAPLYGMVAASIAGCEISE